MANITIPNKPALADAMKQAMVDQRAGRLDATEAGYRRVLGAIPTNANANHLLGLILTQSERAKEAVPLLKRAVNAAPESAQFPGNLAEACRPRRAPQRRSDGASGGVETLAG